MALKFWLGGEGSDKSRRLIKYILDEADKNPQRQYLYVVPEQFGLATQRALVTGSKNRGILNIDVLSFTRLAHRISDEVGSYETNVTTLDEMGKSLIIGMLATKHRKELSVFAENIDKLGYVDKIKSVISEFMQYGITVEKSYELAVSARSEGRGLLAGKLNDIAFLYEQFREYIKNRYTTVEETLDIVSSLVPHSSTVKNSVIVFDGFTGFTPVQNKLIGVLMDHAIDIHVALLMEDCIQENNTDDRIKEHELFYLSQKTMNQLGRMADERQIIIADPYKADKTAIHNIRNSNAEIVYTDNNTRAKLNNTAEQHLFVGQNPSEEIRMLCNRIRELVRKRGYRYKDIGILAGDIEGYRHLMEREFDKHGIPFFIDRTEPVLLNPFIEYIRSFIGIFCDNYSIRSVFRFLKSGLCDLTDDEVYALENYCLATNTKGYRKWHERFDDHTQSAGADELLEINATREKLIERTDRFAVLLLHDKDAEEQNTEEQKDAEAAGRVNAASKFTVKEFCVAIYRIFESERIEEKLKAAAERFGEEGNRKYAAEYGRIYVKVCDILDELCALIPDEKMDIRGFSKLLDAGLDTIRIGILPAGLD